MSQHATPLSGGRDSRSGDEERPVHAEIEPLRAVFDTMFEGVQILDSAWRYVYLNNTAVQHSRQDHDDLIGSTIFDRYPGFERSDVFKVMQRCMEQRVPANIENRFTYPDDRSAWFDLRINPIPQGLIVLSIDITDRKKVENELRHSKHTLGTTLECISQAVISTDTGGRIRRMNPAAEELLGQTLFESEGQFLSDVVRFEQVRTGESVEFEFSSLIGGTFSLGVADNVVLVSHSGIRIPVSGTGAPIRENGDGLLGGVLVLRNIKEELELLSMFQHAQKMEAVGQLAGGVAHDYNNMLTIILGYCEMLFQVLEEGSPVRKKVDSIHKAGTRAADLTRKLLTFSRKQLTDAEVFDANGVVDNMVPLIRGVLSEDIELEVHQGDDLGEIYFDVGNLEQILVNMAINARDAMPDGGTLSIKTANVPLDEHYARTHPGVEAGDYVMVAVSDTGIGMTPDTRSRIFEPFFTTKDEGKGTGLGLPMVYGLVKQSGGHIWVYSEPGLGSTFKIYFPFAAPTDDVAESRAPRGLVRIKGEETILVVEDDDDVRDLVLNALEADGFRVLAAEDGTKALEQARQYEGTIHVLLSDVVMPGMSGPDLGRAVKELRPGIMTLFMSGYLGESVIRQDLLEEGDAFIEKPFTPTSLVDALRTRLDG